MINSYRKAFPVLNRVIEGFKEDCGLGSQKIPLELRSPPIEDISLLPMNQVYTDYMLEDDSSRSINIERLWYVSDNIPYRVNTTNRFFGSGLKESKEGKPIREAISGLDLSSVDYFVNLRYHLDSEYYDRNTYARGGMVLGGSRFSDRNLQIRIYESSNHHKKRSRWNKILDSGLTLLKRFWDG